MRVYQGTNSAGRRLYVNRTVKGDKKAAQGVLDGLLTAVSSGVVVNKPRRLTVSELLDLWLENHVKECRRERTYDGYVWTVGRYIRPRLGRIPASLLQFTDIEANYSRLRRDLKLSSRTVRMANALLSAAYNKGIEKKWLPSNLSNPCNFVSLPEMSNGKKRRALSVEAQRHFLQTAKQDRWGGIFHLALESGLRPEEYLGLTWSDLNLDTGELAVVRTLVWRKEGEWYFSVPKTERGDRSIIVSEDLRRALVEHRRRQLEERLACADYQDNDLVFAHKDGRPVLHRTLDRQHFKPILERAGLPSTTRLYDLRHSCASLLIASGESPKVVADRLGHGDPAFTLKTYVDTDAKQQKAASEKLARMLTG